MAAATTGSSKTSPSGRRLVAGDDHRGPFVSRRVEMEEVGGFRLEGDVAPLADEKW